MSTIRLTTVALLAIIAPMAAFSLQAQTPVAAKALLRIDAEAENLSAISTLAVSPSGILAVYLRQDGVIRLYSPAGKPFASAGHAGRARESFDNSTQSGGSAIPSGPPMVACVG
ncbi:MAG: hypothetical protein IPP98_16360 [Gemmatimonadetes bacterium]|nr:hypothetical protein [Gemmatimonadota bacterium]